MTYFLFRKNTGQVVCHSEQPLTDFDTSVLEGVELALTPTEVEFLHANKNPHIRGGKIEFSQALTSTQKKDAIRNAKDINQLKDILIGLIE